MEKETQYLVEKGLAVLSCSPWCSPCLLFPKPDGTSCFCTDYRKVNTLTKAVSNRQMGQINQYVFDTTLATKHKTNKSKQFSQSHNSLNITSHKNSALYKINFSDHKMAKHRHEEVLS